MSEQDSQQVTNDKKLPNVGADALVRICPSMQSERKYLQGGSLRKVRLHTTGLIVGTINITRNPTDNENPHGLLTDGAWLGCDVAAVFNPYSNDWRATVPLCERAKKLWGSK
jgi:hypothetical protein